MACRDCILGSAFCLCWSSLRLINCDQSIPKFPEDSASYAEFVYRAREHHNASRKEENSGCIGHYVTIVCCEFICVGHVPLWVIMLVCFKQGNGWNKKWLFEGYNIVTHVLWAQTQLWYICLLPMTVASGWVYFNIPVKTPLKSQVLQNQGVLNKCANIAFPTGPLLDCMCSAIREWQINTLQH